MDNSEELVIGIKKSIADQLEEYLVKQNVEQGCLIGSSCYLNQIDRFAPVPGIADENHFTPDMKAVNRQIEQWAKEGICFCGFIHSHPNGARFLSQSDHQAVESWVCATKLPFLSFGVVDGIGHLELYLAYQETNGIVVIELLTRISDSEELEYVQWRNKNE